MKYIFLMLVFGASPVQAAESFYRVKAYFNTGIMKNAGLLQAMDHENSNDDVLNSGSGSLEIVTGEGKQQVTLNYPGDSKSPVFNLTKIFKGDSQYFNLSFILKDRDYLWINPVSWLGFTDDRAHLVTIALGPNEEFAIEALTHSATTTTRVMTSNSQISAQTISSTTKSDSNSTATSKVENRTFSSVQEYRDFVSTETSLAFSVELTRIKNVKKP